MPRGDRTGPNGAGSRTGRGLGFCNGNGVAGFQNNGFGRGFGVCRGFGRGQRLNGFGRGFGGVGYVQENLSEIEALRKEIANLKNALNLNKETEKKNEE